MPKGQRREDSKAGLGAHGWELDLQETGIKSSAGSATVWSGWQRQRWAWTICRLLYETWEHGYPRAVTTISPQLSSTLWCKNLTSGIKSHSSFAFSSLYWKTKNFKEPLAKYMEWATNRKYCDQDVAWMRSLELILNTSSDLFPLKWMCKKLFEDLHSLYIQLYRPSLPVIIRKLFHTTYSIPKFSRINIIYMMKTHPDIKIYHVILS